MRTQKELANLLRLLYLTQAELTKEVNEAQAAECDCPNCNKNRLALAVVKVQIDTVLYAMGADSATAKFVADAALKEAFDQEALENKYAEIRQLEASEAQVQGPRLVRNARFN